MWQAKWCVRTRLRARAFTFRGVRKRSSQSGEWAAAYVLTAGIVRTFALRIYRAVTLFAGNIFLDEIGVLQAHEFDGEAIFDMAHDAPLRLADRDDRTNRWSQIR